MGQAKLRGTFEERRAQSIIKERRRLERLAEERVACPAINPNSAFLMAMAATSIPMVRDEVNKCRK